MSGFRQALPSTATAAGDVARRLLTLKGPAIQAPDGSLNAADALALGASLEDARSMLSTARAQAFVCDATYSAVRPGVTGSVTPSSRATSTEFVARARVRRGPKGKGLACMREARPRAPSTNNRCRFVASPRGAGTSSSGGHPHPEVSVALRGNDTVRHALDPLTRSPLCPCGTACPLRRSHRVRPLRRGSDDAPQGP